MSLLIGSAKKTQHVQERSFGLLRSFFFHCYTLWLFVVNDIKTMVVPSTAFAFFTSHAYHWITLSIFIQRLPMILSWALINLLAFAVNNQRHPASIKEDILNKPWRPIPSGRITATDSAILGRLVYSLAISANFILGGGHRESILLAFLGWLYNDKGWGNSHWFPRNTLNAAGFTSFASGAVSVSLQSRNLPQITPWLGMVAAIVGTTVHLQDMYDQLGDSAAGRKTLPLTVGDGAARWSIAVIVMLWSMLVPLYWQAWAVGGVPAIVLGATISLRTLMCRTVRQDRVTFHIYNVWLMSIYSLPLCARRMQY